MTLIRRLSARQADFADQLAQLLAFDAALSPAVEQGARDIITAIRSRGDEALLEYTRRFDQREVAHVGELEWPAAELEAAYQRLPQAEQEALRIAAERIRRFHERQKQDSWQYTDDDGTLLGQQVTALDRVGIYVPGGKAAYPSSVLMNAIPAQVAGVSEIIMVSPLRGGAEQDRVLAAAWLAGVHRFFSIGGAQAVAALAYGTATIPAVDKITGPGNAWVAAAKRQVFGQVGIDMIAGPSEILVIADGQTPADWVAMDLFSQAEHDEVAQSILLCPDAAYLNAVEASIARLLPSLPRADIIRQSLANRGALIEVADLAEACLIANQIAPEHLELSVADPQALLPQIRHAGAIFMGAHTTESLGDYCAGPNHVLPTSRSARFSSPLGVYDFQKRSSLIQVSPKGADQLGQVADLLAQGEGLMAHALAARYRTRR
ncbi:histidinol dehydrogenase [Leeia sp. IMCC25680]|uniref:Histidinol dehydrogenase n=1 Tax=Leeia aquatica TaxID=2725557 RepID=A0A847SHS0_9NEIS|nr:histidinol dehydrogenase [Leeia aquatica]